MLIGLQENCWLGRTYLPASPAHRRRVGVAQARDDQRIDLVPNRDVVLNFNVRFHEGAG
jgi:hypothetical protein